MYLKSVTEYPRGRRYKNCKLQNLLETFMGMSATAVKCEYNPSEYVSIDSARNSIHASIKRYRYPVYTVVHNGELYLMKLESPQLRV